MRTDHLNAAVPREIASPQNSRVLAQARDAVLAGQRPSTQIRSLISESWQRVRSQGVDPDSGADLQPVSDGEVQNRRASCGLTDNALSALRSGLVPVAESVGHIMVVVDVDGHVLWREGHPGVFRRADRLGLVEGACWSEPAVGTNAIGTTLVEGHPVQVHSAEHFVRSHHAWTCAAAPIRDPGHGRVLAVVDVSGPAENVHPSIFALVQTVAALAETRLRETHRMRLDRLRAIAAPLLAKLDGQALVTDRCGWVAASIGLPPTDRVALPGSQNAQQVWIPAFGTCSLEPLPEGLLLRPKRPEDTSRTRVVVDVRDTCRPALTVHRKTGSWTYSLSPRHADILLDLASEQAGRTAAELAEQLFGDPSRTVTVRAEMSRLRKRFADLLDHRPYRFLSDLDVTVTR